MPDILMMCGHRAQGVRALSEAPVCVICDCDETAVTPDLTGREAVCQYGDHARMPSAITLAYFAHRPDQPTDSFYCGCYGWD